jgi:hypothetical protein
MEIEKTFKQTPESLIKIMSVIHLALLAGQMLFALAAFAQSTKIYFGIMYLDDDFVYTVPLLALIGFFGGYLLFKKQLKVIRYKSSLNEKFTGYQTALIIRYALLEGPSLFAIVAYMLNGNLFFLSVSGFLMLYFIFLRPTTEKIDTDLQLDFDNPMRFL